MDIKAEKRPGPESEPIYDRVDWHVRTPEDALKVLDTDQEHGLSDSEVRRRQEAFGPNELIERGIKSPWRILVEQFTGSMVVVLFAAALVSLLIGDVKDSIAILAIVILNAAFGFAQENRAERAMAALKKMSAPRVVVRRGGSVEEVEATELVPGDVIQLEAGSSVPADARVIASTALRVEEASLTGESQPSDKRPEALQGDHVPLADRHNMVYLGTVVTYGRGTAVVVETGMRTELGRIAELIQKVTGEQTPLQRRMGQLGRSLALVSLLIVTIVFALGLLRGEDPLQMFLTAVALAVAVIPEGLPAVVTISLALGAQRMLRRKALIRKLPAVETLGSVTVICSDKTGTLTENRMTVRILDVAEHTIDLEESMRSRMPVLLATDARIHTSELAQILLLAGGALCNDAALQPDRQAEMDFNTVGDPTDGALLVAAARFGLWRDDLEAVLPRVAEIPFSSERKRMTTVHEWHAGGSQEDPYKALQAALPVDEGRYLAFTKGAVDNLLERSDRIWVGGVIKPLSDSWRSRIDGANEAMAQSGLRVLGVAFRQILSLPPEEDLIDLESDLVFVGMVGMMDPPRPEVEAAVQRCRTAGIRPVMITGDHPLTAQRIARDLKISSEGRILTGADLAQMPSAELESLVEEVSVYARVSPEHKLEIVQALQNRGHIVAMTGDGVNDAPALKRSDIGVAMGVTGTDVAKEAADMVILDDNFATIVNAVEEGRTIYENVRKFIRYTLTSNAGEILAMLLAPIIGMPLPLTALQVLWVNLVTDGLPGLALSVEPTEPGTMKRRPYPPGESVFARGMAGDILWVGALMGSVSLGVGFWGWVTGNPVWPTMVFTTLTLSQMGNALALRSNLQSLFRIGLFSNKLMLGAVLLTFGLQLALIYLEPLRKLFGTQSLPPLELTISLAASTLVFWAVEAMKGMGQRHRRG